MKKYLIILFVGVLIAIGQTLISTSQIRNFTVSPVTSIERWECTGSGTNTDGTNWNCGGVGMIRLIMLDGTVIGPFVTTKAPDIITLDGKWQVIPIAKK